MLLSSASGLMQGELQRSLSEQRPLSSMLIPWEERVVIKAEAVWKAGSTGKG